MYNIGHSRDIMSMLRLRLAAYIAIVFTSLVFASPAASKLSVKEWEELSRPPADSVQARDTRIWFSLQTSGSCRTRIEIEDTAGVIIRHLADEMLGKAYYNLYWDKKDDSGSYVPEGLYYYRIKTVCIPEMKRKLRASYFPFERVVRLSVDTANMEPAALIAVDTPKVRLSLDILRTDGPFLDSLCPDTVLTRGVHRIIWQPSFNAALGEYFLRMKIDNYSTKKKIRLR